MLPQYITIGPKAINISGQRFGRLIALGPVTRTRHGSIMWLCRCDCGNMPIIVGTSLRGVNHTESCGCLHKETTSRTNSTHRMGHHPAYKTWCGMKERCLNPRNHKYPVYGARGIGIHPEWIASFESFFEHVSILQHCGEKGYSLDRIDNDGNYEPGNVRWATPVQQQRNTSRNAMITHDGITLCISEWAERIGVSAKMLGNRLRRDGWTPERALTTPIRKPRRHVPSP